MNNILSIAKYWAIEPDFLKSINENLSSLSTKESLSRKSEQPLENTRTISIRDGTAIIPIHGPIIARDTLFSLFAGATTLETLAKDFNEALNNEDVKSILFDIDSPGGVAIGPFEMAQMIYNARSKKPIYSYIGRSGCSAAYWLASATEKIIVNPSALVGSIGVVTTIPVQEEPDSQGYKNIEIVSSNASKKRPDPKTYEGISQIRQELDEIETTFINSISKYRGVTPDIIKSDFGGGGVIIGNRAVNANMADDLGTYEETLELLRQKQSIISINNNKIMSKSSENKEINANSSSNSNANQISRSEITANYIKAEFPDIANSLINEASSNIEKEAFDKGIKEGIDTGIKTGKTSERNRILAIESASLPGHEDLIKEAKKDGNITAESLALRIIAAEKQKGGSYLANIKEAEAELPKIEPNVDISSSKKDAQEEESNANLPLEDKAQALWKKDKKLRAEFCDDFESYLAFAKADETGQVRILSNN